MKHSTPFKEIYLYSIAGEPVTNRELAKTEIK